MAVVPEVPELGVPANNEDIQAIFTPGACGGTWRVRFAARAAVGRGLDERTAEPTGGAPRSRTHCRQPPFGNALLSARLGPPDGARQDRRFLAVGSRGAAGTAGTPGCPKPGFARSAGGGNLAAELMPGMTKVTNPGLGSCRLASPRRPDAGDRRAGGAGVSAGEDTLTRQQGHSY